MNNDKKTKELDKEIERNARASEIKRDELYSSRKDITPQDPKVKSMLDLSRNGINFIKEKEGYRKEAYEDVKGVWTIGYGHTGDIKKGMIIDDEEAERLLKADVQRSVNAIKKHVKVPLNQNQFDALVSFQYNTGALKKSTLLKKLNNGDYKAAFNEELLKWDKITKHGKKIPLDSLTNRRKAERDLANKPIKI